MKLESAKTSIDSAVLNRSHTNSAILIKPVSTLRPNI